jgi:hypothetical protein
MEWMTKPEEELSILMMGNGGWSGGSAKLLLFVLCPMNEHKNKQEIKHSDDKRTVNFRKREQKKVRIFSDMFSTEIQ